MIPRHDASPGLQRSRTFWRVFGGAAGVAAVAAGATGLLAGRGVDRFARLDVERSLVTHARAVGEAAGEALATGEVGRIPPLLRGLGRDLDARLEVISAEGRVLADSEGLQTGTVDDPEELEIAAARARGSGVAVRQGGPGRGEWLHVAAAVRRGGRLVGFARASIPTQRVETRLAGLRTVIRVAAVSAGLVALLLAWLLALRVARPVSSLALTTERMAEGGEGPPAGTERADEVGRAARAVHRLTGTLRSRVEGLRADREELRAALGSMVEGVIAVDRGEVVLYLNEAAAGLLGIRREEATGAPLWQLTRAMEILQAVEEALQGAAVSGGEARLPGPEREQVVSVQASPVRDGEGRIGGAVLVLQDVTELRRLETVRTDFVANVSHELKTPVAAIRALAETLIDDAGMDRETHVRFLAKIRDQCMRLTDILADLLVLSRAESGAVARERRLVDLRLVVQFAKREQEEVARRRQVDLAAEVPEHPVPVLGDEEALQQLLGNLVDNAIKYTPEGGKVVICLTARPPFAVLEVQDTGIGIESRYHERVFERFYRVDKARSRAVGGTGLGLSIVKHIALAHRGRVSVESAPGEGSTFTAEIPLAPRQG